MSIIALRGGKQIVDEIEIQAYLASILRLENVGLLLGAGASSGAGGQTMKQLWKSFLSDYSSAADWLLSQKFISQEERRGPHPAVGRPPPPPDTPSAAAGAPPAPAPPHGPPPIVVPPPPPSGNTPNIEQLVDKLEVALIEWERKGDDLLSGGKEARSALLRSVLSAAKLDEAWWGSHVGPDLADGLADHRAVLQKLTASRQPGQAAPWVFTTNYDLAVEWAAESVDLQVINGFLGLHSRRFSPQSFDLGFRNTQAKGEARFGVYNIYLAKLHGSLTWKEIDHGLYEVPASEAWRELKDFMAGTREWPNYLVLPRAAKYLQTVGYVTGELLRRFAEFMSRPQTALIINGYGFGDEHINRLLRSALLNPTLQLVIYLPEFEGNPASDRLAPTVRRLLALQSPRITIVGGGDRAYLSSLAADLPDPTIYDHDLADLRRRLNPEKPDGLVEEVT